jgi:hypothetical protein
MNKNHNMNKNHKYRNVNRHLTIAANIKQYQQVSKSISANITNITISAYITQYQ